jgi:catechol 2,3-dioxygenase-like lactoylglutathione lyase family enzyme
MFSHVMVGSSNLERSRLFYDAVFGALGVKPGVVDRHRVFWRSPSGSFGATLPINGEPQTHANGGTIGFTCDSPAQVDGWHAAGVQNGGASCEDPPGIRQGAAGQIYLAYMRDPDGNKLCAIHRMPKA